MDVNSQINDRLGGDFVVWDVDVNQLQVVASAFNFGLRCELLMIFSRQCQRFQPTQIAQKLHRLVDFSKIVNGDGLKVNKEVDDELAEIVGDEEVGAFGSAADD